jgi:hypothetical protein
MILYKYLKRKYLEDFKKFGLIKINTLHALRTEHESIRDSLEGYSELEAGSENEETVFTPEEFKKLMPSLRIPKTKNKIEIAIKRKSSFKSRLSTPNAYVFCTSYKCDTALASNFGYDAYYKIMNPEDFAQTLFEKLNEKTTLNGYEIGKVTYTKRITKVTKTNIARIEHDIWEICFSKPIKYCGQCEYRMVFLPQFQKEIEPKILSCPELLRFCAF